MNGLLIIDKPAGITSHDVVSRVRRILKIKRVGHTGTLDPFATGVMVILVGQATRLAQFLDKDEKEYEAVVKFGFATDTGDATGSRVADNEMRGDEVASRVASVDWGDVFGNFRGRIEQIPPMFSAKKIEGQKLYEHARKGKILERKPVAITISKLGLLDTACDSIRIRVVCSAGTYIRTLAEDIGSKIGIGAHLAELRRTRAGKFSIEHCLTLDQLENLDRLLAALLGMSEAVSHLPILTLPDDRIERTNNGLSTRVLNTENFADGDAVQMHDARGNLIAVGVFSEAENSVRPKVVLAIG